MVIRYAYGTVHEFSASAAHRARRLFNVSDPRYRRAGLTAVVAGGASATAMLVNVVTMPLLLHHFGAARFGVWMTLYSFVSMLGFLDLGVGLGLLTALAQCHGSGERNQARLYVSSASVVLIMIAVILLLVVTVIYPSVPWGAVFNVNSPGLVREARNGVIALTGCLILAIPANLPARVQAGYQKGYIASAWDLLTRIATLFAVLAALRWDISIPWIVVLIVGLPSLGGLLNGLVLFSVQSPWLRPARAYVDFAAAKAILHKGTLFLVLQVAVAMAFASDNMIITQTLGPSAVAAYAVPAVLFQMVSGAAYLFLAPLWPAYGEALAQGHGAWIAKTLRRSLLLSASLTIAGTGLLIVFGKTIVAHWVGPDLQVSYALLSGFALFVVLTTCGSAMAMLMNAASVLRFQVVVAVTMAVASVAAKMVFARWFGIAGVIWGAVATYTLITLVPYSIYVRRWI